MATTATAVASFDGVNLKAWDLVATADSDTTFTITHGLGFTPDEFWLSPFNTVCYVGQYAITTVNSTQVVVTKNTAVGSGSGVAACRIYVGRAQSIIK